MISINATLILQILQFLVLVHVLNRLMIRPIRKVAADRTIHIREIETEAASLRDEAAALGNRSVVLEDDIRRQAVETGAQLRREATVLSRRILGDAGKECDLIRHRAEEEMEKQMARAREALPALAADIVDDMMGKILGEGRHS